MAKKDSVKTQLEHLKKYEHKIRSAAKRVKLSKFHDFSCSSLMPLALALFETADLIKLLFHVDKTVIRNLFCGDEDTSPNIDTRLRCIRDLCSACVFGLTKRSDGQILDSSKSSKIEIDVNFWKIF